MKRIWVWRPQLWWDWRPFWFGGDEYGRRTLVIGWPWTGRVIIAVSRPDYLYPRNELPSI